MLDRFVSAPALDRHHGTLYLDFLELLMEALQPRSYLEIGTQEGESLSRVHCPALCVDPAFELSDAAGDRERTLLFQQTSDDFFAQHDPGVFLGGPVDVAFIDGRHLAEYALRDIANTESAMAKGSVMLVHDCLPLDARMARRERVPGPPDDEFREWWTGDVWKVLYVLRSLRPDLQITYLDCPPTGLVMLSGIDPDSRVLAEEGPAAIAEVLDWDLDQRRRKELFTLFPTVATAGFDAARVRELADALGIAPFERRHDPPGSVRAGETRHLRRYFEGNRGRAIHKWVHYFDIYERHLSAYRGTRPVVLEVGVADGGSLEMWRDYFGDGARIVGVDLNPKAEEMRAEGFEIFVGDQASSAFWAEVRRMVPAIDVFLDDGGHRMDQQRVTFREMFPAVTDGGLYLAEDLHTSYWRDYGGGLGEPESFVEFAKTLVDELHGWFSEELGVSELTRTIGGLHFYDSVLVVEKRVRDQPVVRRTGGEGPGPG